MTAPGPAVTATSLRPVSRWRARVSAAADALWRGFDVLFGRRAPWGGGPAGVVVGWVLTRAFTLLLLVGLESTILNDVRYYAAGIAEVGPVTGPAAVLREYPTPVLGLLALPWVLARSIGGYVVLFVAFMLVLDAAFTWLLARHRRRAARTATTLWLVAGPALGPLALTRFDVVPGMLAAVALLLLLRHPRTAGGLVTLGAAIKLWPVLLLPALLAPRTARLRALVGAIATGLIVLAASLAAGGLDRLLSPLEYQTDRGLQVESVAALPLMVAWSVAHGAWQITFSRFITSEIRGPGDEIMLTVATFSSLLALALIAVLWWRAWRAGGAVTIATIGWIMLTAAALFIVTNKVFSPQYLLWLTPIAAAVVAVSPVRDRGARRFTVVLLVVGALTQVIYPNAYVLVTEMSWANPLGVAMLVVRDIALLGLTWYAARRAWAGTRPQLPPCRRDGYARADARPDSG